ncbi:ClpXP protease specificity-enhancing factor [Gammaproteobacteria bacterium AB-CW1]|uniref:ClpXP protease specificity-enhancing factor n=1 Tax=Natronospira elongata TaxID=3110268 RepID=A0AAP6JD99_9GAMM|nr:ClpXP protease specificity-enhancing factor [Gammaproteobacteria bacterium AB-CW1]
MVPRRPYLIRAMHQWMVDSGETPHLLVDAEHDGVMVPVDYVQNGKIILNISPSAVQNLLLDNQEISFNARFGGQPMAIALPPSAVLAIYSRESGQGMLFNEEDDGPTPPDGDDGNDKPGKKPSKEADKARRPNLRVIK